MTMKSHSNEPMPDPREQAEAVALWMGWKRRNGDAHLPWRNPNGKPVYRIPTYADSLDAMCEVEDEIERRGLLDQYGAQLFRVWCSSKAQITFTSFLIRATAAQRLQAAFEVIQREVQSAG